jgi:regulator of sirC expression with transglutaminase-like and TPR domain
MNEYLFGELGFVGDEQKYYSPENSYLNRVIDRRLGNPISLGLVYIMVARRLELPITGIGFPGHFLCRYQSSKEEYYIDAFNGGKLLTKNQCARYLKQNGLGVQNGYLVPISARRVLLRICANLHQTYLQMKKGKDAVRVQRYLVALAK